VGGKGRGILKRKDQAHYHRPRVPCRYKKDDGENRSKIHKTGGLEAHDHAGGVKGKHMATVTGGGDFGKEQRKMGRVSPQV